MGKPLSIDITTTADTAALKRLRRELGDMGDSADKASKRSLSLGQALGGIAIGAGLGKAIGEFEEAEKVGRQTEAVIKSTGNAAQISAEQQDKMVDSLSRLAAVDDEVVAGGANILRTFTAVKGEAFEPALASALDLSAALGKDLQSSTLMVGKALNAPVKGLAALSRAGVQFTDEQKDMVKSLMASGDTLGAQKIILQELETQFGGQAEAAATDSAKMKVAFDNAAESLGGSLAPGLEVVASGAEKASAAFQMLPPGLQQAAVAGTALAIVGPRIVSGIGSAADAVKGLTEAAANAPGKVGALVERMGGVGTVAPVAGAAAAGAGLALYGFAENARLAAIRAHEVEVGADAITTKMETAGLAIEEATKQTVVFEAWKEWGDQLLKAGISIDELANGIMGSDEAVKSLVGSIKSSGLDEDTKFALLAQVGELAGQFREAAKETKNAAGVSDEYKGAADGAAGSTDKLTTSGYGLAGALADVADGMDGGVSHAKDLARSTEDLHEAQTELAEAMLDQEAATENLESAEDSLASAREGVTSAIEAQEQAQRGVVDAAAAEQDAIEGVSDALEDQADAEADLAARRQEAAGDSDAMRDALEGVQDAQENLTDAQENSADAQRDLDQATSDYAETLAGLQSDAAGAADDVLSAEIRLRKAQQALRDLGKPGADGKVDPVSADDRLEAEIAIREAERRLEAARQAALDAAAEVDRNDDGAATSEAVVAASEAVTDAKEDEAAAQEALEGAVQNVADTQVAANEAVAAAEEALAEKIEAVQAAQQRRIEARQSVIDAQGQVQKAAEGVRDAEAEVRDRLGEVGKAQGELNDAADATVEARGKVEVAEGKLAGKVNDHAIAQGLLALNAANSGVALGGAFASGMQSALDKFDPNDPKVKTMKTLLAAFILLGGGANGGIGSAAAGALGGVFEDLLRTSDGPKGKGSKSSATASGAGVIYDGPKGGGSYNSVYLGDDGKPVQVDENGAPVMSPVAGNVFNAENIAAFRARGGVLQEHVTRRPVRDASNPPININVHGVNDPAATTEMIAQFGGRRMRQLAGR